MLPLPEGSRPIPAFLLAAAMGWLPAIAGSGWDTPRFPDDASALYRTASAVPAPAGADVVVLDEEESFVFDAQGATVHTRYLLYRVLTQKGAEQWDGISVDWQPWHEERPAIRARVITADGAVHPLDLQTISDAPAREEDSVYNDQRVVRAPLPAIAPGSLVEEEETTRNSVSFFPAGTVCRFTFGRPVPVHSTRLLLDYPASLPLRYELRLLPDLKPARSEEGGRVRLDFQAGSMEALEEIDPYLPDDVPASPAVTFSTGTSWERVAAAYGEIVDRQIAAADVKAIVSGLTKGKKTREEKISAISRYLGREIRYTGVEFGDAAITPRSPSDTLKQKYGDCKDKATLLVAMLRAAGIPSQVALLKAGSGEEVTADLPGIGMFNHAIAYVPGSPEFWIDATDEYSRPGELPLGDQGRYGLIALAGTASLVRTPVALSKDNLHLEKREFTLSENGPARVVETTEPHGSSESEYRASYADKDNKEREKRLAEYMKSQYLAEKLSRMERSDPDDLSRPFQLVLEAAGAKRGITGLDSAVVAIPIDALFALLPEELREREKEEDKKAEEEPAAKPRKPRTADYQLEKAFVTEWRYRVTPPAGFRPKPVPPGVKASLGPAELTEEFSADPDGVVRATLRFDTVKRRFSVAEASAMKDKILELRRGQPILIYFEPTAQALLNEGKVREALQAYRDLMALHPKEAVHHLQIAQALLAAGMGQAARDEARLAVNLEPGSALAQAKLADILEFDLFGRKFRRGSDYPGAVAAFREARKLDPDDHAAAGNLAILLEYNEDGERYGPGSRLKEAAAVYASLKPEELTEIGLQNNPVYALLYSGQLAEARKAAEGLNPQATSVIVATEAAVNGAQAGIAEARKRTGGEADLKQVLMGAAQALMRLRIYPAAADLFEAGASGSNASNTMALAAMLRKTSPHEGMRYADDPAGIVKQFFALIVDSKLTLSSMQSLSSRNARKVLGNSDPETLDQTLRAGRQIRTALSRTALPGEVIVDVLLQSVEAQAQGDDASGYKVTLRVPGGKSMILYLVKEDGRYGILDSADRPNAVGLEILDRVAAGNLDGARMLLDWLREDQHLAGDDDPLAGLAFPRMWAKGKVADGERMKLVAAAILVQAVETAKDGIAILEPARSSAATDADRLNVSLALMEGYVAGGEYGKLREIALELARQFPESKRAFTLAEFALRGLGRHDEADVLAQERLKRLPDDLDTLRALAANAVAREDYALAVDRSRRIVSSGKAEAGDLNDFAWNALFTGKVGPEELDAAVRAAQMGQNRASLLHTLGCVYAEAGKTKEAREVLIQAMDQINLDEPDSNYWYAFGRIAEQYGEREIAKGDYARVTRPKKDFQVPGSSYRLAQNRLKVLEGTSKGKTPAGK